MSKGSKKVVIRLPDGLDDLVKGIVLTTNAVKGAKKYTLSSWIRKAICEKLNHLKRSKRSKGVEPDPQFDELLNDDSGNGETQ
jgi:hypothetical protein